MARAGIRADLAVRERTDAALGLQFAVVVATHASAGPMSPPPSMAPPRAPSSGWASARRQSYEDLGGIDPVPQLRRPSARRPSRTRVAHGRRLSLEDAIDLIEEVAGTLPREPAGPACGSAPDGERPRRRAAARWPAGARGAHRGRPAPAARRGVPSSRSQPSSRTAMRSAWRMVERRWATTIVVRPTMSRPSASWTSRSDSLSSELVASSRMRMGASLRMARAMATRCRWPPERRMPRSPRSVS